MTTRFKNLVDSCGFTLTEAAEFLNIPEDTARSWSCGRRPTPTWALLELLEHFKSIDEEAQVFAKREEIPDNAPRGVKRRIVEMLPIKFFTKDK